MAIHTNDLDEGTTVVLVAAETESSVLAEPLAWLEDIYSLVAAGDSRAAADILCERIDDMLLAGEFARCDGVLRSIDIGRLDSKLLVTLLSVTVAAAGQLTERSRLVTKIERRLAKDAPERIERMLEGLR
ncbi:MAG: hypothetical protein HC927_06975 [Deltaproteobacteria bacterium]|nr:hypothetical protein [Deltaproteobacteria bacterium]